MQERTACRHRATAASLDSIYLAPELRVLAEPQELPQAAAGAQRAARQREAGSGRQRCSPPWGAAAEAAGLPADAVQAVTHGGGEGTCALTWQ